MPNFDVKGMDPIASHQGALYMDGEHKTNCIGFEIKGSVQTKSSRVLGQQSERTRVTGVVYTGTAKFYKNDPWLRDYVMTVQKKQYYPHFDLTGVIYDEGSDFTRNNDMQIITCRNCVLTGDITMMMTDNTTDNVEETVAFSAEYIE